jgi:4-hydroxy-3-methylbut-2-enyl diphosphate reductase
MEVKLARTAGFCMGVRLAMDKVLQIAERSPGPIYTHGPLIHNRQAVEMLASQGVRNLEDAPDAAGGTVLIRAHGVPEAETDGLRDRGFEVVDATCPHVLASQRSIVRYEAQGYHIVVAGDTDHAEVTGLVSRAPAACVVVSTPEEARAVELAEPLCLLAQTTFSEGRYAEIAQVLRERFPDIVVIESICHATRERQEEVLRLAREVEAMVVVGGRHSANTRRLAELAHSTGIPTFHVETAAELDVAALAPYRVVGLTAGASTPNWITRSVLHALEDIGRPAPLAHWLPWRALAVLVRSNVYSAAAAIALTYAASLLLGIEHPRPYLLLAAFCYVFAVTTLNRITQGTGGEPYLPPRVTFFRQHHRSLLALSAVLAGVSMWAFARRDAWAAMALLLLAYLLGVAYSVRLVPRAWLSRVRYARLKDLPASKDLFVGLAWVFVCVLVPWLDQQGGQLSRALVPACLLAFVLTFVKATVVDLADMQEDHLLGRETLPIVLGERKTRRLLIALTAATAAVLALSAAARWTAGLGWLVLLCPAYVLAYLRVFPRRLMMSDVLCALVADGALLLAGLLALLWTAF